jgi:hypothetical protein
VKVTSNPFFIELASKVGRHQTGMADNYVEAEKLKLKDEIKIKR